MVTAVSEQDQISYKDISDIEQEVQLIKDDVFKLDVEKGRTDTP